ncbi:FeoA family protein [Krasilnikovia sp. MM14-A1259]|uniref:FeoA family protein n=1 Tax=Krasilnikovia sp. MM14-A1259 TaxID=3373539 RepID=UPI003818E1CF
MTGTGRNDSERQTLADLPPGARARVASVRVPGSAVTARRLMDLGFTTGTEVQVVRRAPLRDPVVYRVKDYEICLRRAQASCVQVVEVSR